MRQLKSAIESYPEKPKQAIKRIKYDDPLFYRAGKEKIDVLRWFRWPSYDFIFGIPAKGNPFRKTEVAFFQYRDSRTKKVKEGFYVDREELKCLVEGFNALWKLAK